MKSFVPLTAALVVLVSGCATLRNAENPLATAYSGYDQDEDGVISRSEAADSRTLAENFDRIDTNHSDGIDSNEYAAATVYIAQVSFSQVDINGDGVISEREAAAMPVSLQDAFSDVDADGDSNVSPAEYDAATTNLFQGVSFGSLDKDHDGVLGTDEADGFPPLAEDFDRVDSDADGLISQEEFAAAQRS